MKSPLRHVPRIVLSLCSLIALAILGGCEQSASVGKPTTTESIPPSASIPGDAAKEPAQATGGESPAVDETEDIAALGKPKAETKGGTSTAEAPPTEENLDEVIADAVATKSAVDAFGNPVVPLAKPKPGGVKVLVPEKEFEVEGPDGALRVSYDDLDLLKVINMEPVTEDAPKYFPDWLKNLEGQRVRIRGFMYPEFQPTGLEMFSLARDTQICCFGRDPKVYDVFRVILREGVTTDYIELKPFDVVGVFHIDPVKLGDDLVQMYYIDDAVIVRK